MKHIGFAGLLCALAQGCSSYTECGLLGGALGLSAAAPDSNIQTCQSLYGRPQGFSETPLAGDTYRIQAFGNSGTSRSKTNAIAMVRAAELADQNGFDRFILLDFNEWEKTSFYTSPSTATTDTNYNVSGYATNYGNYSQGRLYGSANSETTIHHGQTETLESPRTDMVVKFIRSDSREGANALRVADIIARYGRTAGYRPKEASKPMQPAPAAPAAVGEPLDVVEAPPEPAPIYQTAIQPTPAAARISTNRGGPTLDEIYKSLPPGEKARVDRLPPGDRAAYLRQIAIRR